MDRIILTLSELGLVTRLAQLPLPLLLECLGLLAVSPARGPPAWEGMFDQTPVFDPTAPVPEPDYEFDQRVTW
jgi:hypothetical protein